MFKSTPEPKSSPWGKPDQVEEAAPGIWRVFTPGHGGFLLSPERMKAMPIELRVNSYGGNNAFEEDCEWALVFAAFYDELTYWHPKAADHIERTLVRFYSDTPALAYWMKTKKVE